MSKSIDDILRKMELDRSQKIANEKAKIDSINRQRDIARKEWIQRNKMYESISNSNSSSSAGSGGNLGIKYITIIDTTYIYPLIDINQAAELAINASPSISITKNENDYIFQSLNDLVSFYEQVYFSSLNSQPIGNAGYSLDVGTILRSKKDEINLKLNDGTIVIKWLLMEQITNQSDLSNSGDSPNGTIGYGAIYTDWNLDTIADDTNITTPSIYVDAPRFEIYNS